jgi:hypothetical protein
MVFIFFLVHLFFATVFYILSAPIEATLFLILWIVISILFFPFSVGRVNKEESTHDVESTHTPTSARAQGIFLSFFRSYTLPLALLLFYLASFWILWSLSIGLDIAFKTLAVWFICSNILASLFLKNKINQRIGGGDAIVDLQTWIIVAIVVILLLVNIANYWYHELLLSLATGLLLFFHAKALGKSEKKNHATLFFMGGVFFSVVTFQIFLGIIVSETIRIQWILLLSLWIIGFEVAGLPTIRRLQSIGRIMALFLVYGGTSFAIGVHIFTADLWQLPVLVIATVFNLFVHRRFENYPSLFMAVFAPITPILTYISAPTGLMEYILTASIACWWITFLGRVLRTRYNYDEYVYQALAILLLIIFTIEHLVMGGFQWVLQISCILLLFSILFFVSFLQIRNRAIYAKT